MSVWQCYSSSRNHFYFSFYSVHDELNSVIVEFLLFECNHFSFSSIFILEIISVLVFVVMPQINLVLVSVLALVQTSKSLKLLIVQRQRFTFLFSLSSTIEQQLLFKYLK